MENTQKKKLSSAFLVAGLIFGLIGLPLVLQKLYNVSAIEVSFAVILIYLLINWLMKKRSQETIQPN